MAELTLEELSYLAAKARLPEKLVLDTAKATVASFRDVWPQEKNNLMLSKEVVAAVDAHLITLSLLKECSSGTRVGSTRCRSMRLPEYETTTCRRVSVLTRP